MAVSEELISQLAERTKRLDELMCSVVPEFNGFEELDPAFVSKGLTAISADFANYLADLEGNGVEADLEPLSAEDFYHVFTRAGSIEETSSENCKVRIPLARKMKVALGET
jgi:hypothetical protein